LSVGHQTEAKAIAAWNTRPAPKADSALVDRAKEILQSITGLPHESDTEYAATDRPIDGGYWPHEVLDAVVAALSDRVVVLEEAWQPKIGAPVRMTDACPDAELWNKQEWFVAGLQRERVADRYTGALDVFVSASWPEITDPTDGFLINRPDAPDQLEPRIRALKGGVDE
tara:strand:- start:13600 stop:14109 length:510 start_codon:yes stop_codon:yes gene_type:complete